jgi:type IV pilus assembly protein PilA
VEIMIVVVIIGLLAALAIPAFQRVQRASQNARAINDFRVFSQAFEIYNSQNGAWPNNAGPGAIPASPVAMNGDFKAASWQATTVIGGRWNWDNYLASGGNAGICISTYTCTDAQLEEIDAKIDDGDLTTGNFLKTQPNRVMYVMARGT